MSNEDHPMPMDYIGTRPPGEPVYLGDGAYAHFDGFQIWLTAEFSGLAAPSSTHRVALEPSAFLNLLAYAKRYWMLPP